MYCVYCGTQAIQAPDAKFCQNCGKPFSEARLSESPPPTWPAPEQTQVAVDTRNENFYPPPPVYPPSAPNTYYNPGQYPAYYPPQYPPQVQPVPGHQQTSRSLGLTGIALLVLNAVLSSAFLGYYNFGYALGFTLPALIAAIFGVSLSSRTRNSGAGVAFIIAAFLSVIVVFTFFGFLAFFSAVLFFIAAILSFVSPAANGGRRRY